MKKLKFPSAYTILMLLTVFMAALTWLIPAGQYQMVNNETLGKMVPLVGSYQTVASNPQGIIDILMAPIQGFYDPGEYMARAVDVALFVLVIGGYLAVVTRTGAIDAGIAGTMAKLNGREKWMIPILMGLFALGGTVYGMAEETIPFALLIPVMIAAGYDSIVGVALIIAIARGLVVVMDDGNITHTILNYAEGLLAGLPQIAFINAIYWVEAVLCLVVPSSSGLAVLSMPVLAPLADFAGVSRELVVTAFQSASGLPNLVTPTSGVVMGGLAIGRVAYSS